MKKIVLLILLLTGSFLQSQTVIKVPALPITTTGSPDDYLIKNDASGGPGTTKIITVDKFISNYFPTLPAMALSATSPLLYNSVTSVFSMTQANGSTNGWLSNSDWTTFNNKQATLTFLPPLSVTSNVVTTGGYFASSIPFYNDNALQASHLSQINNQIVNASAYDGNLTMVASASILTLTASDSYTVTGTSTITGIADVGGGQAGAIRTLIFAGACQLTNNNTSFQLPTGANITTAAGDVAQFIEINTSGYWKCISYTTVSGNTLANSGLLNYIPVGVTINIPVNTLYLVYGNLTIAGTLNNQGSLVVINGNMTLASGIFNNTGTYQNVNLKLDNDTYSTAFTLTADVPITITHGLNSLNLLHQARSGNNDIDITFVRVDANNVQISSSTNVSGNLSIIRSN